MIVMAVLELVFSVLMTRDVTPPVLAVTWMLSVASIGRLVAVTAVWGSTFVVVKDAVAKMPVMDFLAWRFGEHWDPADPA